MRRCLPAEADGERQANGHALIGRNCTGCGRCVAACPQRALSLQTELPNGFGRKTAQHAKRRCTGCGLCLPACPHGALRMSNITDRRQQASS